MPKRRRSVEDAEEPSAKRFRPSDSPTSAHSGGILKLSDELLLRIASYLSVSELNTLQLVCHSVSGIATDWHLWKSHYYNSFVHPRASRIPGSSETRADYLDVSSSPRKWLNDGSLVKKGIETNWKRKYKLRHRWSKGSCEVREIEVAEQPSVPPQLVHLHDGVVYTVDAVGGLRAYSSKKGHQLLGSIQLEKTYTHDSPTCFTVDLTLEGNNHQVVVGFEGGSYIIFDFCRKTGLFAKAYSPQRLSSSMLAAVAFSSPYLIAMSAAQEIRLYKFSSRPDGQLVDSPRLLQTLSSHIVSPPYSLSIRPSSNHITATVAFSMRSYPTGWLVGIQEQRLSLEGELLSSRFATSQPPYTALLSSSFSAAAPGYSKPTSISYTHPYMLLSHADNTLTSYLVKSTPGILSIGPGNRLWGHTSAVAAANVGARGKAVSVTHRGDDLRIWELEGQSNRRIFSPDLSVRIRPETTFAASRCKDDLTENELSFVRGWVGFDEENVVVLKERTVGRQALVVYDFS
jgi:hypothetical protein